MKDLSPSFAARVAPEKRKLSPPAALNSESNSKERLNMNEIWKPVAGHKGYYVSNLGRHGSTNRCGSKGFRVLYQIKHKDGYMHFRMSENGKRTRHNAARTVLTAFIGKRPEGMEASHLDGTRDNNRLDNLVWETRKENFARKKEHGTQQVGEKGPNAKLADRHAAEIRRLFASGRYTYKAIGDAYGVTYHCIYHIIKKINFKHI